MRSIDNRQKLVVLIGPTGVGKSALAITLAQKFKGEIVSADSRLFYRGLDIGTAKPSLSDRAEVPHHLVDVSNPDDTWSLARFQNEARAIIADIHTRGALPLLVGGTGQYIRSVIEDWIIPSQPPQAKLRQAIARWGEEIGSKELYDRLVKIDPLAAAKIDPRNLRRIVRALEVIFHSGNLFSTQQKKGEGVYNYIMIGLWRARSELYHRIDDRIEGMFENGLLGEVRNLLDRGYDPGLPSLSAIGYHEAVEILQGRMSLEVGKAHMRQATHQYVRRQANWFKENDPNIHWVDANDQALETIERLISFWLGE